MFFQVNSFQVTAASTRHVYEANQDRYQHYALKESKNSLASAIAVHGVLQLVLVPLLLIIPIVTVIIIQKIIMHQPFYMRIVRNQNKLKTLRALSPQQRLWK